MRTRTLYIFLLCLFAAVTVRAQQPVVKSFRQLITDHIPADLKRYDNNNKACALVKVQVVADITDVQGARIGDVVKRNATEKWVYMCDNSPKMKVFLKNCLPIEVNFAQASNNEIRRLKSNYVYELVIEVPNVSPRPDPDAPGGNMKMMVTPVTTEVTIWGNNMSESTYMPESNGVINIQLPYGRYYYRAKAEGYHPLDEATFFFSDESDPIVLQLTPIMGQLVVNTSQKGVFLFVDGQQVEKPKNVSTWNIELPPGQHSVEARREKCQPLSQIVNIQPQQVTSYTIPFLKTDEEVQRELAQAQEEQRKAERLAQEQEQRRLQAKQDSLDAIDRFARQQREDSLNQIRMQQEQARRQQEQAQKQQRRAQQRQKIEETDYKSAQFGIIAGLNMATAAFGSDYDSPSGVTAFHVGMTLDVRLSKGFYFSPGLVYSAKGYKYASDKHNYGISEKANPQFIDIPLLLSLRTAGTTRLQFSAGPYLAMAIGGKVKDEGGYYDVSFSEAYSGFDYGMQVGAQLRMGSHFSLGASYQMGMASSYQNRCLGISLGYHF